MIIVRINDAVLVTWLFRFLPCGIKFALWLVCGVQAYRRFLLVQLKVYFSQMLILVCILLIQKKITHIHHHTEGFGLIFYT